MARSPEKLLDPYLDGGDMRPNGDLDMHCPLHEDKRRSAVVNFRTREWYCNACEDGGSLHLLIDRRAEWMEPPAGAGGWSGKQGRKWPLPDPARLDGWQQALLARSELLEYLEDRRGLTRDTIQRAHLGWDGRRYTIPVTDDAGALKNIRCYSNVLEPKYINWPGHGSPPRLYPFDVLLRDPKIIFVVEGEFDALLGNQIGMNCVTATAGVKALGRWRESWSSWFKGKIVYICFDRDKEGALNARRCAEKLERFAKKITIVELPYEESEKNGKDLGDYLLDGGSPSALRKKYAKRPQAVKKAPRKAKKIEFGDLRQGSMMGKPANVEATLSGIHSMQLSLPIKLHATCNMDWDPKRCATCPMGGADGQMDHNVEYDVDLHIDLLNTSKSKERDRMFKEHMGIPSTCSKVKIKTSSRSAWDAEFRNGSDLQEQSLPMLLFHDGDTPEVNHLYRWTGQPIVSSHGSRTLFVARAFEPAKQDLDNFEPDEASAKIAREWVDSFDGQPEDKIAAIGKTFEKHVSHIFEQPLLHIAIDLTYHSILAFDMPNGEPANRGWMEALIVGKTRSGKTTTAQALQKMYGFGHLRSGENTTVAGLLMGQEKRVGLTKDGSWAITLGELPLSDRRLLIIDEAQGLPPQDIGKMSDVRSRGVVDVIKIRKGTVDARVRLIWLANQRKLNYKYNINALADQMGAAEDLARVDIPLWVDEIEQENLQQTQQRFEGLSSDTVDIIRWLVLWAWSRRRDQVKWTESARVALYNLSKDLSEELSIDRFPILPPSETHVRLARMAVAVAARLFSSPDGHTLLVRGEHVAGAYEIYRMFLSDPRLGVTEIKDEETAVNRASDNHAEKLRDMLLASNPEILNKMAMGEFSNFQYGAAFENAQIVSELGYMMAIIPNDRGDYTVSKWAQEIAKDIERERREQIK